jgi:predicted transposase/invertase (TIGR01784 family)
VGILDFVFNDPAAGPVGDVLHEVKLKNQQGAVFYDKLTYYYLEMPNFRKTEAELTTRLDQWLYFLKHLEELQSIQQLFRDEVFTQAFETAAIAQMSLSEWEQYEGSLKSYRDEINMVQTARQEGMEDGLAAGMKAKALPIASAMKAAGLAMDLIAQTTGLTILEIEAL